MGGGNPPDVIDINNNQEDRIEKAFDDVNIQTQEIIENLLENGGGIVDSNLKHDKGYVRFKNGFQIAWINKIGLLGGTAWQGLHFSDVEMGTWDKPFKLLFGTFPSVRVAQYWAGQQGQSTTSGGWVRAFRPNANADDNEVTIFAIGTY